MTKEKFTLAASSDYGTVVKPDQMAVIYDPTDDDYRAVLPDSYRQDGVFPEKAAALLTAVMRIESDAEFCRELATWYFQHQGE